MEDDSKDFGIYPIADNIDNEILMHRDAHFGGRFSLMIDYYNQEGKGAIDEIDLDRILFLANLEEKSGQNLAPLLLSGRESSKVGHSKEYYKKLRDVYDEKSEESDKARLVADLILSEEEYPEKEINSIVEKGSIMVPALIEILNSDDFLDPLFPGYGFAPELAAICLGKIKDQVAIKPLFSALGKEGFFMEESILEALKRIDQPAKLFLIKTIKSRPITIDNEKAALALTYFSDDEEAAKASFEELLDPLNRKNPSLATYLIFASEGLKDSKDQKEFKTLSKDLNFLAPSLLNEMKMIVKVWEK